MAQATNGEVWYERSVKVADYENKKFGARISYILEPGDDAEQTHELFARQVVRKVEEALGLRKPVEFGGAPSNTPAAPKAVEPTKLAEVPVDAEVRVQVPEDAPKPKGKPGRPKGSGKKVTPQDEPEVTAAKRQDDPSEMVDHPSNDASQKLEEWRDQDVPADKAPAAPAVTDADLGLAARRKAEEVGGASKIKEFIQAFFGTPCPHGVWKLQNIPLERRAEFLEKLEAFA